jgi:hypothetical protein
VWCVFDVLSVFVKGFSWHHRYCSQVEDGHKHLSLMMLAAGLIALMSMLGNEVMVEGLVVSLMLVFFSVMTVVRLR